MLICANILFWRRLCLYMIYPSLLDSLDIIDARTCPIVAIFMCLKLCGPMLIYGPFDCVLNPFPSNVFPLIRLGRLSIAFPHLHTQKGTRTQLLSLWVKLVWRRDEGNRSNCINKHLLMRRGQLRNSVEQSSANGYRKRGTPVHAFDKL